MTLGYWLDFRMTVVRDETLARVQIEFVSPPESGVSDFTCSFSKENYVGCRQHNALERGTCYRLSLDWVESVCGPNVCF